MLKFLGKLLISTFVFSSLTIATLEAYNRAIFPELTPRSIKKATLFINTFPQGAEIILDGRKLDSKTPSRLYDLPVGEVNIQLTLSGFLPYSQKVFLKGEEDNRVEIALIPQPSEKEENFYVYVKDQKVAIYPEPKESKEITWAGYKEKLKVLSVTSDGLWFKVLYKDKEGYIKAEDNLSRKPIFAHALYQNEVSIAKIHVFASGYLPSELPFQSRVADFQSFLEPLLKSAQDFHTREFLGESSLSFEFKGVIEGQRYQDLISNFGSSPPAHYVYTNSLFAELLDDKKSLPSTGEEFVINLFVVPNFQSSERKETIFESYNSRGKYLALVSEDLILENPVGTRESLLYALVARCFGLYSPYGSSEIKEDISLSNRHIPEETLYNLGVNVSFLKKK